MCKVKSIMIGSLIVLAALNIEPASAASYTVGGNPNGTSTITGGVILTVAGSSISCGQVKFTVVVTSGAAKITAANFYQSAACQTNLSSTAPIVSWPISPPTNSGSPPDNLTITNMRITNSYFSLSCPNAPSTGSVKGGLTSAGALELSGTLGVCSLSTSVMTSSPALKPVFP